MPTSIHNHFNLRRICQVELSADVLAKLERPPELKEPKTFEDHVVMVPTPHGDLVLFPVFARGARFIATPTPDIALAVAAPD